MKQEYEACCCCNEGMWQDEVPIWIGDGNLTQPMCLHCYSIYNGVRTGMPDRSILDLIDITRLTYINDTLPAELRPKFQRLLILLNNGSQRAHRMINSAYNAGISVQQMLQRM